MRRDPEVVRAILTWIEREQQFDGWSKRPVEKLDDNCSPIEGVAWSSFYYNLLQCELSGLTISNAASHPYKVTVSGLTPDGHDFLEAFRKPGVWERVNEEAIKAGGFTLSFFVGVAKGILRKRIERLVEEHVLSVEESPESSQS